MSGHKVMTLTKFPLVHGALEVSIVGLQRELSDASFRPAASQDPDDGSKVNLEPGRPPSGYNFLVENYDQRLGGYDPDLSTKSYKSLRLSHQSAASRRVLPRVPALRSDLGRRLDPSLPRDSVQ